VSRYEARGKKVVIGDITLELVVDENGPHLKHVAGDGLGTVYDYEHVCDV